MKKVPLRMCVGCRAMKQKSDLLRIVKTTDGVVSFDAAGKMNGRGAYICKNADCYKRAEKSKAFSRAFKTAIPDEIFHKLENLNG